PLAMDAASRAEAGDPQDDRDHEIEEAVQEQRRSRRGKGQQEGETDEETRDRKQEQDDGRQEYEPTENRDSQRTHQFSPHSQKGGAGRESFRRGAPGTNHAHRSVPLLHDPTPPRTDTERRASHESPDSTRNAE